MNQNLKTLSMDELAEQYQQAQYRLDIAELCSNPQKDIDVEKLTRQQQEIFNEMYLRIPDTHLANITSMVAYANEREVEMEKTYVWRKNKRYHIFTCYTEQQEQEKRITYKCFLYKDGDFQRTIGFTRRQILLDFIQL